MTGENTDKFAGIALRCGADGAVREVISDSLGAENCIAPGAVFADFVDAASRAKADSFFEVLRKRGAAFGWEMNVACDGRLTPVFFAASAAGETADKDSFVVVGAKSRGDVSRFYQDLIRINNEQTNAVRLALKDLSLQMREQNERDSTHYDELSRLNNELATVQRELAKKNFELARLNEQKNQFLGMAAHDLRNPLEVIQLYSEFLLEEAAPQLTGEQIGFIHKIYASSALMLVLVNDFLDYAKIEAGRFDLALADADLTALVERVIERSRVPAGKKEIVIDFAAPAGRPSAVVDETKIEQVLHNLLGNAVKYSPPGSRISIAVEPREAEIVFAVADQGPGIAAEEAETLFAPFVRGRSRPTSGEKSSGLGLAIVRRIVDAHGGRVHLASEPGAGATFFVALPRRPRSGTNEHSPN